jgi:hypothetical protein
VSSELKSRPNGDSEGDEAHHDYGEQQDPDGHVEMDVRPARTRDQLADVRTATVEGIDRQRRRPTRRGE